MGESSDRLTTELFISYASEDQKIADALETAFKALAADGDYSLEIHRDVHSFQQGSSLRDQIRDKLRASDILFIIYTERLKRSHSWGGFEVGIFTEIMARELKETGKSDRRAVSFFLEEQPPTELGMLGIKVNVAALDRTHIAGKEYNLDPDGELEKFLLSLSDMMVQRQFNRLYPTGIPQNAQRNLENARNTMRTQIHNEIMPKLHVDLVEALSRIVAMNYIEQKFIQLRWEAHHLEGIHHLSHETIITSKPEIYKLFGINETRDQITWKAFFEKLSMKDKVGAEFIKNALQNAVMSAFSQSETDNDQIFLTWDRKLYRIIVTRYYVYFDGGRTMHVYLIPFLNHREHDDVENALILLRLAAHFRSDFIHRNARFRSEKFDLFENRFEDFRSLVLEATRQLLLSSAASHNCGLDSPINFEEFFGAENGLSATEIAKLYRDAEQKREGLFEVASRVDSPDLDHKNFMSDWRETLSNYSSFMDQLNKRMGLRSLERLNRWFERGKLDDIA